MVIGIDASRAFSEGKTGTENYSYHLITHMLRLPEALTHNFVLFTRPNAMVPSEIDRYSNVIVKEVKWRYLWTQVGLAWSTREKFSNLQFSNSQIEVLWVPAHTLPVLRRPGLKTVVTIHGLEYQWLPEYKNWLQRWYLPLSTFYAAKSADRLILVSKFSAKQLLETTQIDKKKIKVIYEGVVLQQMTNHKFSNSQIEETLEKYGLRSKKYILFVGTIQPRKNLVALIEAFSRFNAGQNGASGRDYKLVLAGAVGWMAEDVLQAPGRYDIADKVVFAGRVDELVLRELYLGAAVYVQPSITEGFGLPVLEAMASGVAVISSDGGALTELVKDAGVIVKFSNQKFSNSQIDEGFTKQLAEAIKRVISNKLLQKKLASMGLKRVKDFSWEKAAKDSLEVIVGEGYNRKSRF